MTAPRLIAQQWREESRLGFSRQVGFALSWNKRTTTDLLAVRLSTATAARLGMMSERWTDVRHRRWLDLHRRSFFRDGLLVPWEDTVYMPALYAAPVRDQTAGARCEIRQLSDPLKVYERYHRRWRLVLFSCYPALRKRVWVKAYERHIELNSY